MRLDRLAEPRVLLYASVALHVVCALVLLPVTSHPYDLAVLSGSAQGWLDWGFSPLYNWKFGLDYTALTFLALMLQAFLSHVGVSGVVALHVAWKLPLVAANLATAGVIYRLGLRLAPGRAAYLAALWLVNPVVLWVSAGHGQIESIAILCLLASLQLALSGRLFWAGVVTGLGVGIEYFPIVAIGAMLVWWRGGQLAGTRPLEKFGAGLASSLAVCFGPIIIDSLGRTSLSSGLLFSGSIASNRHLSVLSLWAWIDYRSARAWPIVFFVLGLVTAAAAWHYAKRGPHVGLVFLSVALALAVLLNVNDLPQFSLIAAAALWLMALAVPVNPVSLVAVPVAGLATIFLGAGNTPNAPNAFFYDDWTSTAPNLWVVPSSANAAIFVGHIFSLGLAVTIAYALLGRSRSSRLYWPPSAATASAICVLLSIWALQPAIWQSAFNIAPGANIPGFDPFVATRPGRVTQLGTDLVQVNYSEALVATAREADVQPLGRLNLSMSTLYQRNDVGTALNTASWSDRSVTIPDWERFRPSINSIWVEVLVGSAKWSATERPTLSEVSLDVGETRFSPQRVALVASSPTLTSWAVADFLVPASAVDPSGSMQLLPVPTSLLWNGSDVGPWVRIGPASGTVNALADLIPVSATFQVDASGRGYAEGFPIKVGYVASLTSGLLPDYLVTGASLHFPAVTESWKSNPWLQLTGALLGVVLLVLTGWLTRWCLKLDEAPLSNAAPV